MPQINLVGGPHGSFVQYAGTADEERYEPYPEGRSLTILKQGIYIIQHNIYKKMVHCNRYFGRLPKGRSFDDVWDDASIWINYDPRVTGATSAADTDITIYEAFRRGRWWVAGTIVHELAHTNGASSATIAAETALKFCGLAALFDPGAVGLYSRALREDGDRLA